MLPPMPTLLRCLTAGLAAARREFCSSALNSPRPSTTELALINCLSWTLAVERASWGRCHACRHPPSRVYPPLRNFNM
ncbi:hypothetical protein DFH29DRAFT_944094 [Suillus ampliporus]|nr:hypothetical protein DFH29DRAFT_944094 [Suillus ampliporus]